MGDPKRLLNNPMTSYVLDAWSPRLCRLLFVLGILIALVANGDAAPIETLPRDTIVTIRNELMIPANRDYILLGHRLSDQVNNALLQPYNQERTRLGYTAYRNTLLETYEQSYGACIETHRRFVSTGSGRGGHIVVNQSTHVSGNYPTVINTTIVNPGPATPAQTFSYITTNDCIPPEYTLTLLAVEASGRERLIAADKTFQVRRVETTRNGIFNEVIVRFDHPVVRGLVILTTHDPRDITVEALSASSAGGFINALHSALLGIAGENIAISLPQAEYIE